MKRFRADDFLQGNIILELVVPEDSERLSWLRWLHHLEESETPEYVQRDLAALTDGALVLLTVTPSYGATVAALGTKIVVE